MKIAAGACLIASLIASTSFGAEIKDGALTTPRPAPPLGSVAARAAPGDLGSATMTAEVDLDGTLLIAEGAVFSTRIGVGRYQIGFGRDVRSCVFSVTNYSAYSSPPFVTKYEDEWPEGVYVRHHQGGTFYDTHFYLIAVCGR